MATNRTFPKRKCMLIFLCLYACFFLSISGNSQPCNAPITAFVSSINQLQTTISNTKNYQGEVTITIQDGIYTSNGNNMIFFINRMGSDCTYKIEAQTTGGVEFVGYQFMLFENGKYHVDGIRFSRNQHYVARSIVRFTNAENSIIENCSFYDIPSSIDASKFYYYIQLLKGAHNTLRNCDFEYKLSKGNVVQIQVDTTQANQASRAHHQVLGCHFKGQYLPTFSSMIAIGLAGDPRSETSHIFSNVLVKDNIFEDYNVNPNDDTDVFGYDEIISNKSSGNLYINNTFLNCNGRLKLRSGSHCTIDGNRFVRQLNKNRPSSAGLRFNGPGHQIINNYFENIKAYSIYIYCGYGPIKYQLQAGEVQPCYQNPDSATIAYNTIVNTTEEGLPPMGIIYFDLPANASCPAANVNQLPRHMKFENNIICRYGATTAKPFMELRGNTGSLPPPNQTLQNSVLNTNIFYSNLSPSVPFQNISFSSTNQLLFADPDLQLSGQEYIPSVTSIAANRADNTNHPTITADINAAPRNINKEDIGCHEFEQGVCQANLDLAGNVVSGDYEVSNSIYASSGRIQTGENVVFQAGNEIIIDTTFTVDFGVDFTGEIINCQ